MLRSMRLFLAQIALLAILPAAEATWLAILSAILEALLIGFLLIRFKMAVDRNYRLVLEKTHQIPPQMTAEGANGSQSSFL
ncbi:hypothetical protein ACFOGI_10225 [Virgibacillus xinjiangensis]|uniref:Uncharacterized protein n=1 Tax=Virgibacillus xinjiangensis TaxID=393090 RepID=A0ABV7CWC0_9BACI